MRVGDKVTALKTFQVGPGSSEGRGRIAIREGEEVEVVAVSEDGKYICTSLSDGGVFGRVEAVHFTPAPACHYCGALDWDFDEDRRTTCCQSL